MKETNLDKRLRRLIVRSHTRGTMELCVLLKRYLASPETQLDADLAAQFECLLHESDPDVLAWIAGQSPCPGRYARIVSDIARTATGGR